MFPNECLESTQDFLMTRLVSAPGTSSVTDSCLPWGGPIATGLQIPYLFQLDCLQIACCSNELGYPIWGVERWPRKSEKATFTAIFSAELFWTQSRWLYGYRLAVLFFSLPQTPVRSTRTPQASTCTNSWWTHWKTTPGTNDTRHVTQDSRWCLRMCDCNFTTM